MFTWDFPYPSQRMPVLAENVVATSQPLAAQAGLRMLLKGGNAVDAALATAIALAVVEPTSNGIGSDAFAIVWDGKELHGLNGSGRSPKAWSYERFAATEQRPTFGWDTVTVPGAVSVWVELSNRFGRLPFEDLFEPAVQYAGNGYPVSPVTAERWGVTPELYREFPHFIETFAPGGRAPEAGERFRCPDQAQTLEEIARTRGESFYRGRLAERIEHQARNEGGLLTTDDLAAHRPDWVQPLSQDYHGVELNEIPPNGQGLAALIALGILGQLELANYPIDSADSVHLQLEAMKLALADVKRHLADLRFMEVDPGEFLEPAYLASRARLIDPKKARFPDAGIPRDQGTVYLAAADADGVMVSLIQSNYMGFGSGVVIEGTGISLQNRGLGFTLERGHPNQVDGGKRPYHTIIPGFVMRDGQPLMSFGVMGGHMQAQGHVQMVVRIFDYEQNPQAASDAPRWFLTENTNYLGVEPGFAPEVLEELDRRGHRIVTDIPGWQFGGAQLIYRADGHYVAGSDHRKDGLAVGF